MAVRIIRINDIVEEVLAHHPGADVSLIHKAYILSAKAHEGQTRLSGEPYLSHPLEVAYLMAQMGLDPGFRGLRPPARHGGRHPYHHR